MFVCFFHKNIAYLDWLIDYLVLALLSFVAKFAASIFGHCKRHEPFIALRCEQQRLGWTGRWLGGAARRRAACRHTGTRVLVGQRVAFPQQQHQQQLAGGTFISWACRYSSTLWPFRSSRPLVLTSTRVHVCTDLLGAVGAGAVLWTCPWSPKN